MPLAIAVAWDVAKEKNKSKDYYDLLMKFDSVLSLDLDKQEEVLSYPKEIDELLEKRKLAREEKDYKKSDEIREEIKKLGYDVKDTRQGQIIEKI